MTKNFDYYLSNFLKKHLSLEENASPETIRSYEKTFELLLEYLVNNLGWKLKEVTFENITRDIMLDFLNHLENERNNSIRTRNQRLGAIKSFYNFVILDNVNCIFNINQILNIKTKKFSKPEQDYLTVEEVKMILDSIDTSSKIGRRNLVILSLLYDSAARANEITYLKVEDIRFYDKQILLDGKGKKKRLVPIMENTINLLNNYLKENNIDSGSLFKVSLNNNTFIKDILTGVIKLCEISKKVTPHTFRRSRATHLLEAGVSIFYIKDLLGHSTVETTEEYLKVNNKYKKEAIEQANKSLPKTDLPDWTNDESLLSQLINL